MTAPADERTEYTYTPIGHQQSLDDDGTVVGDDSIHLPHISTGRERSDSHLTVETENLEPMRSMQSPSQTREQAHRLDDDLAMLQVERQVSSQQELNREQSQSRSMHRSRSTHRSRSRREDPIDEFDAATNPLHEKAAVYKPPEHPSTNLSKFVKKVHNSSFLVRYFTYITPLVLIILIPILLGALIFKNASVGGVQLMWFGIWLEIVWLTLWAGRVSFPISFLSRTSLTLQPHSFLRNVCPGQLGSYPASSPTTARNGEIWESNLKFQLHYSSGGWL